MWRVKVYATWGVELSQDTVMCCRRTLFWLHPQFPGRWYVMFSYWVFTTYQYIKYVYHLPRSPRIVTHTIIRVISLFNCIHRIFNKVFYAAKRTPQRCTEMSTTMYKIHMSGPTGKSCSTWYAWFDVTGQRSIKINILMPDQCEYLPWNPIPPTSEEWTSHFTTRVLGWQTFARCRFKDDNHTLGFHGSIFPQTGLDVNRLRLQGLGADQRWLQRRAG